MKSQCRPKLAAEVIKNIHWNRRRRPEMYLCKSQHTFVIPYTITFSKNIYLENFQKLWTKIRLCSGPTRSFVVKYCITFYLYTTKILYRLSTRFLPVSILVTLRILSADQGLLLSHWIQTGYNFGAFKSLCGSVNSSLWESASPEKQMSVFLTRTGLEYGTADARPGYSVPDLAAAATVIAVVLSTAFVSAEVEIAF